MLILARVFGILLEQDEGAYCHSFASHTQVFIERLNYNMNVLYVYAFIIISVHVIKSHLILRVIQMSESRYEARIFEIRIKLMT